MQKGARCVQGHPIPPGGSFCMEGGHPIALDSDAFGPTAYGPPGGGYGGDAYPPPPQQGGLPPPPPPPPPTAGPPMSQMGQMGQMGQMAPKPGPAPSMSGERRTLTGFLISFQDDPLGKFWPLYQGKNLVGRAETGQKVEIPIAHGTTSTHHATVDCEGGRMVLSDLGSTNGTFHNEEAIGFQGRRELRDGDRIRFGGFSVIVINVVARS